MTEPTYLNTSHQTVSWFAAMNRDGNLKVRPPFQRRPVWTQESKAFFIDSILRGMPVPEIYVQSVEPEAPNEGDPVIQVVDGQQRIRACLEYLENGFPVSYDVAKIEPLYSLEDTPWYGKKYSQLSSDEKRRLRRYKLIVRDLEETDDEHVRHIFSRLNQSTVALNAQELRYSMYPGGMLDLVESLVKRGDWQQFRIFSTNQRRRMLDSEFISELVVGHLHGIQNKKDSLDHYYRQYAQQFPFYDDVERRFTEVLEYLTTVFPDPRMNGTRWYRKSDFYTLFLALSRGLITVPETPHDDDEEELGEYWDSAATLRNQLTMFSSLVDSDEEYDDDSPVGAYRSAVERAATDRTRRTRRERALLAYLDGQESASFDALLDEDGDDPDEVEEDDED